jgi:hypothetical protein
MESSLLAGNDMCQVFYVIMAVFSFLLWRTQRHSSALLVLSGIFAGVCLSIKYTALLFIPAMIIAGFVWDELQAGRRFDKKFMARLFLCAGAAGAVFLPWCIKNFIATGNPLYPALYPVLGGADMNTAMYETSKRLAYSVGIENIFAAAAANVQAIFVWSPHLFLTRGTVGNAGLIPLFFIPLLPLVRPLSPVLKTLCSLSLLLFLLWTGFSAIIRFFYPGMALLLIIASFIIVSIINRLPRPFKPFISGVVVLCIILNAVMGFYQANMRTRTFGMSFLQHSDETYLMRHAIDNPEALLTSYPANSFINEHLDPNACVLIVGDVQHLYIHRRHRYTYQSATTPYEPFKQFSGDYQALAGALKKNGITHILYNPLELFRLQDLGAVAWKLEDTPLIEDFLKSSFVRRIYFNKRQSIELSLYELL